MLILPLLVCIHFFLIFPMHFSVTKLFNSESMKKKSTQKTNPQNKPCTKVWGFLWLLFFVCLFK